MRQVIVIDPKDNVATAIKDLRAGERIDTQRGAVVLLQDIPFGHKVALEAIPKGEVLVKYGAPIGRATVPIEPGEHVHVHNVEDITDEVRKGV
jgi:predicted homoserine dehydrogenase-like protein